MLKGLIASFIVVALCVIIHIVVLALLIRWLMRHPLKVDLRLSVSRYVVWLTRIFAIVTLLFNQMVENRLRQKYSSGKDVTDDQP